MTSDQPAGRVVSLVPSITEALASIRREAVVGATDWCTHPTDLDETLEARVRGTKNPDLDAIRRLRPDVVIANREENRELDVRRLRDSGVRVEVTRIETVPEAVAAYEHLCDDVLDWPRPEWLARVRDLGCGPLPPVSRRVAMAVWRDPWMVVGPRTFTGDLMRRLGWANVYDGGDSDDGDPASPTPTAPPPDRPRGGSDRYPHVDPAVLDAAGADAVLLPDEPYVFTADDGPEVFARTPIELVSGRLLTWYGPSLLEAFERYGPTPSGSSPTSGADQDPEAGIPRTD